MQTVYESYLQWYTIFLINKTDDVISIVDSDGVEIAGYEYDEWGQIISISALITKVKKLQI